MTRRIAIVTTTVCCWVLLAACSDDTQPVVSDVGPADIAAPDAATPDQQIIPGSKPPAIDGLFQDWAAIGDLIVDPSGDASGGFDLTTVKATSRGTKVYLYFEIGKTVNAHNGPPTEGTLYLELSTSSGKTISVNLRAREAWQDGDTNKPLKWSEIDYMLAPTYASKTFELRLDLARTGAKLGDTITLSFDGSDKLAQPATLTLSEGPPPAAALGETDRAAGTTFRVASLNTFKGALTDPTREPAMGRLLKAAAADVYCLSEIDRNKAALIAGKLTTLDPYGDGATWTTVNTRHMMVATRGTLKGIPGPSDASGYTGAAIDVAGSKLVAFSVHAACCSYIGSAADLDRIAQMQELAATIKKLRDGQLGAELLPWKSAPVVVLGDWNLVGSRTPLDLMEDATTGPGLKQQLLRHLNSDDVYTWRMDGLNIFPPSMLDIAVHSSDLTPLRGYVLDTADLDASTLKKLGLQTADSQASDHLLMVTDLAISSAP
jgi:endonuclease/exonuclease/phosphatase family metal-dependent hydrolase